MPRVLDVLRTATRDQHARLESRFDLESRLSSRDQYTRLLEGYLGLYRPFESRLARQPHDLLARIVWPDRRRTPLLEQDLRHLGLTAAEINNIPECDSLPPLDDPDSLWGALYVIEGSNLGGQIIYRQIESRLALDRDNGVSFFFSDGADTGLVWKRFISLLEEHVSNPERAANAACAMFGLFERWLTQTFAE